MSIVAITYVISLIIFNMPRGYSVIFCLWSSFVCDFVCMSLIRLSLRKLTS